MVDDVMASHDMHGFLIMGEPCPACEYKQVGERQRRMKICPEHKKLRNWSGSVEDGTLTRMPDNPRVIREAMAVVPYGTQGPDWMED